MAYNPTYNVVYRPHGEKIGQLDVYKIDDHLERKIILPETYVDLYAIKWMYPNDERPLGLTYKAKTIMKYLYLVRGAIISTRREVLRDSGNLETFAEKIKMHFEDILKEDPISEIPVQG